MEPPAATGCESGVAESEKSGGAVTTSVTAVVCVKLPLRPMIVSGYEPATVPAPTVRFSVEDEVAGLGLNDAVTPLGAPLRLKLTLPLNPPDGVIVRL